MSSVSDINVMMIGARRVGKTCVIASLQRLFNNITTSSLVLNKLNLRHTAIDEALKKMKEIYNVSDDVFALRDEVKQTKTPVNYDYLLSVVGKKKNSSYKFIFIDMPGEYFVKSENEKCVKEKIESSNVIFICIDAVYLMEQKGIYNLKGNEIEKVEYFVKRYLNKPMKKLVLFIPIKCEKYYYENRMPEVVQKIKVYYYDMIQYLKKMSNCYTIAITPVLTLGTVVYDSFQTNNGVIVKDQSGLPSALFKFIKSGAAYDPKYCEQPLIYTLIYLLKLIENKNSAIMDFFRLIIGIPTNKEIIEEINKLKPYLLVSENGFSIIQDPLNIGG